MVRRAAALLLRENDEDELAAAPGPRRSGLGWRCGLGSCCGPRSVRRTWRSRSRSGCRVRRWICGLVDEDRPGRPRTVDPRRIVEAMLTPAPKSLGVMRWSSRLLAAR